MNIEIEKLSKQVGEVLKEKKLKLTTAESCTGGGVAFAITEIPGSSQWFERGFVTYSNESKQELLNVPEEIITRYGAVSEETAIAMAKGALRNSQADIAVSITGLAGPDGGTADKPVGTVWIGWMVRNSSKTRLFHFKGDRGSIRNQATLAILQLLIKIAN